LPLLNIVGMLLVGTLNSIKELKYEKNRSNN
jgi:hypothetical protein